MSKSKRSGSKAKKKGGFVIGRDNFGKISAVEGIQLTPIMKKRADDAERKGLSPSNIARPSSGLIARPERAGDA
jgi:hypothetical protein